MEKENFGESKLRKFEIKEREETKLFFFRPEKEDLNKPEIMVGARDIGPARCLAPVIEELHRRGYPISLLADQPAEKFLIDRLSGIKELKLDSPLGAITERKPGLVLSGISATGSPGIEYYLAKTAEGYGEKKTEKVPVVWVEDFWGVATRKKQLKHDVLPTIVCAFDEFSKKLNLTHLEEAKIKGLASEQFIVTGPPAFDELAQEKNRDEIKKRVRGSLDIREDELMITYMSDIPPRDLENLKIFIDNFNRLDTGDKKIKLTARIHPHVFANEDLAQYKKEYEKLLNTFNKGEVINTMEKFSTDEVAIATDMVVSQYSTEGIKAVYRKKPTLFMLLPDLGAKNLKEVVGMETLPVIDSGASIGVFKEEDMKSGLEKMLDPASQKAMQEAQREHHNLDGQNTKRVIEVIEKLLSDLGDK